VRAKVDVAALERAVREQSVVERGVWRSRPKLAHDTHEVLALRGRYIGE
jgi:hypothetical protein